jgi:putative transposase
MSIGWIRESGMEYRRAKIAGGTYFFTVVAHNRRPFLCEPENIDLLRASFRYVQKSHPFAIDAIVILPDHIHCIWTLPVDDLDFSMRWRLIKSYFSHKCHERYHGEISTSRGSKQEQAIWQRRFWEHLIDSEEDLANHLEYIHYNPVRHGLVKCVHQWLYSSFHREVKHGRCRLNWGCNCDGNRNKPIAVGWVDEENPTLG